MSGSLSGRSYTGNHGDGNLSESGIQNVTSWPDPVLANGIFVRGGNFQNFIDLAYFSDRTNAAFEYPHRNRSYGGRGVRMAQ